VITRRDDALLALLAAAGNGEVFDVSRPERGTLALRTALDGMARTELAGRMVVVWEDRFAWFTFPALLALLGALLLRGSRRPAAPAAHPVDA
jgi:hypothetical protein